MATVVMMPKLSPTMEEGVWLKWAKKEGDKINAGDVIAEVETDKANMDFTLEDEGTLLKQLVNEGDTVKLGAPVAVVGAPGESVEEALKGVGAGATAGEAPAKSAVAEVQASASASASASATEAGRVKASPLARKVATEKGVDLRAVQGSGPGGRVVLRDVEGAPVRAPARVAAVAMAPREGVTTPLSQMRKTVARRLTEAKQTVPHFYLTMDADAESLWALYEQIKAAPRAPGSEEEKVTVNDLMIKAVAVGLTHVPAANASFSDAGIVRHGRVDIGVAVAVDEGLITPVVRDADRKTIGQIARETRDLAARARVKKLKPDEYTGATFSVSNLGMYGVREFAAIINPPESGIVAIGALAKRPVVVDDALVIRRQITLTLSCDHRVVDGALGAELLRAIVRVVERPAAMVL